ncbi:MarR family transcriptional regulator [Archangium violaceum]|nr:MarR family transcriptional regulator [Archangium violaceum]
MVRVGMRVKEGWEQLEAAKRASVGQLLLKCARLLDERAVARVNREGEAQARLRPAHTRLVAHIDVEGTRLTELARRLGVTKQAVGQLVEELVQQGTLELAPDPDDKRARRVRFTPRGMGAIAHGLEVLHQLETELARKVGTQRMRALHETLGELLEALEQLEREEAPGTGE